MNRFFESLHYAERMSEFMEFDGFFRILELYAEENSLDDTMYYLGEALRREKIEIDVFLKVSIHFNEKWQA